MPAFVEYLIKLSICLTVVYFFYQLFLRRLTFYNWNRWYLLGYSALSFVIPVIDIMPQLRKREMTEAEILAWIPSWGYSAPETKTIFETLSYWDWTMIILALGSLFFLLRFITRLYSFLLIKNKATLVTKHQTLLYQLDENITPFSFGNAIFINRHLHNAQDLEEILRHEFVHVKQNHTIDIVFAELICITNWFNPFAWLIRNAVKQNLEFIADEKVVQNGFDKKEYQYLLLKVMGNKQFAITNHFNFSNLKKRIAMMNTLKTAKVHLIKFLFLFPVVAVLLLSFRKEMQKSETPLKTNINRDTIPNKDSGYKISVITTPGGFDNSKMDRTVIDRMSVEDWNKNKEFYEKKYGKADGIRITQSENKEGKVITYDSVYVTRYKPNPIKPGEEPLIIVDGKEIPYGSMNSINSDEIESVSVLKGASETSAYGEKGKNGVIIIEKKVSKKEDNQPDFSDTTKVKMITKIDPQSSAVTKNLKGKVTVRGIHKKSSENTSTSQSLSDTPKEVVVIGYGTQKKEPGTIVLEKTDASQSVPRNLEEVIVEGYPTHRKNQESALSIKVAESESPLLIVDGKEIAGEEFKKIKAESINEIVIFKDKTATKKYGDKGKNGVVEIKLKEKSKEKKKD